MRIDRGQQSRTEGERSPKPKAAAGPRRTSSTMVVRHRLTPRSKRMRFA